MPVAPTSLLLGAIFLAEGRQRLERLTGVVMIGFGLRLATEHR